VSCFIVAGPARSGRSTILRSIARSFLSAGTPVVLAAPRPSRCARSSALPACCTCSTPRAGADELAEALAGFGATGSGFVLIDDAELLRDCHAGSELSRLIAFGADSGRALVIAGDSETVGLGFGGWQVKARKARQQSV
jgi:S-DNA-T family DNA segregation ATPase FtsK/SpoIIIE